MKIIFAILVAFVVTFPGVTAQPFSTERPKVGVVLSGGGAKGLAHIGVLKVLEEAGIPIDFIGGTSMGSIVGGLYSIGYSAKQLDSLVRGIKWDELLGDKISRRNLTMVEKDEDIKYILSFPIREKKISLPSGIVSGQNISQLFSRLTSQVYNIKDFSKFPIPYLCVASDIKNGTAIVLKDGVLADAMRASMAIPTVFTPEEINGRLLLDGGLINNFPVEEVKKMGADIIIGVEVGFREDRKDEVYSLVKIIEKSIFMHSMEKNRTSQSMCTILIVPDLLEYNASSFNRADSLIIRGERAARLQYNELKELASYLNSFSEPVKPITHAAEPISEVTVKTIEISGLKKVPKEFVLHKLLFEAPAKVKIADIDKSVENIYGTWFFERISYCFEPEEDGVKLHFNVIEKNTNYFRAGLHYDSDFKTTLLLNTTFRNFILRGSKIAIDLSLGENPSFSALLYKNTGWNPGYYLFLPSKLVPDFGFKLQMHSLELYQYQSDIRTASYNFTDVTTDFFLQANMSNNNSFNLGVLGDYISLSNLINFYKDKSSSYFLNIYGCYKKDSYDYAFFPSRGAKISADLKYVKGISKNVQNVKGFVSASFRSNVVEPLSKKLSLSESIYGGTIFGDNIPSLYQFFLGGLNDSYMRGIFPFVGMNLMQQSDRNALVARMDLQWEVWKENFITLKANAGRATSNLKDLFIWDDDMIFGYGASFGYRSPIGPMELTIMTSNKHSGLSFYINIGYWF